MGVVEATCNKCGAKGIFISSSMQFIMECDCSSKSGTSNDDSKNVSPTDKED